MPDKTITLTPAQAQRLINTYCYVTDLGRHPKPAIYGHVKTGH